ncbi:amidohydrolase family protein [Streptomyces parvulus]|uniref:metal-dependent hydrolase family protein n=1 Tax=Streptomyces parvulus TaxID=146923 RepID=UPI003821052A
MITDAALVVAGREIIWIGSSTALRRSTHAQVPRRAFPGATLVPGLIDTHVHLGFDGGEDPVGVMKGCNDAQLLDLMLRNAALLAEAGITTARDLGSRSFLDVVARKLIADGVATGPRMVTSGPPLTSVGGHCWFMGAECPDVEAIVARVRDNHAHGTEWVKVMATGGFMTPGMPPGAPQFTAAELKAAVSEARSLNLRVAAHAHGTDGIRMAVEAGVDTVEHCTWVGDDGLVYDPTVTEVMCRNGTYVCATVNHRARRPGGRVSWDERREHLAAMHRAGVSLIAGTDAGIEHTPHGQLAAGLEVMLDLGLTPKEVIRSATSRASEALGLSHVTGRLEVGLSADVLAVDGNPLTDIAALQRPIFAMAGGRRIGKRTY